MYIYWMRLKNFSPSDDNGIAPSKTDILICHCVSLQRRCRKERAYSGERESRWKMSLPMTPLMMRKKAVKDGWRMAMRRERGHLEIFITSTIQVKDEEIEGLEEPYLLLLPPDPESDTEQPPPSRSLQNRVIHIQVGLTSAVERQNLYIIYILGQSRLCQASSLWTAKFWSTIRLKFKAGA